MTALGSSFLRSGRSTGSSLISVAAIAQHGTGRSWPFLPVARGCAARPRTLPEGPPSAPTWRRSPPVTVPGNGEDHLRDAFQRPPTAPDLDPRHARRDRAGGLR